MRVEKSRSALDRNSEIEIRKCGGPDWARTSALMHGQQIEANEDILLYDTGHIPDAVHIDWCADLQDAMIRDHISPEKFARLCSRHGITPDTTCIFYGDA